MKICLIRPTTESFFQITPPLSLGYLSSALKKSGYNDIYMIDGALLKTTPRQTISLMEKRGLPDVVGIQVYTGAHIWTKKFIELLKIKHPKIVAIVGGPHISALKFLALDYIGADYGAVGEGEVLMVDFMKFLEGKIEDPTDIDGFIFKLHGQEVWPKRSHGFITDVNEIPFPDWELLKPQRYFNFMEGATTPLRGKRPVPILTSRGCPFSCTFCSSCLTHKRIMRYRTPENIISEIKFLKEKYKIDEIFFGDDNLTMNIERADKLFDLMIKENFRVHWCARNGIRIDRLNEQLVSKMARSGGYVVGVGIETGNKEVMKRIKKNVNLDNVKPMIKLLHKYGIKVSGFFMCGLLDETEKEMNDSIEFALQIPFDKIQVSPYTPYPGSEDFETVFEANNPEKYRKNVMLFQENGYVPPFHKMNRKKILAVQKKFIFRFYLRSKIIWAMIKDLKLSQIKAAMKHPLIYNFLHGKERARAYEYNQADNLDN
jgi:anaerobic magnesium-protoporphyrin IX monomethyl ester cyclase